MEELVLSRIDFWRIENAMSFAFQVSEACKQTGLSVEYGDDGTFWFTGESDHPLASEFLASKFKGPNWTVVKEDENVTSNQPTKKRTSQRDDAAAEPEQTESGTRNLPDVQQE